MNDGSRYKVAIVAPPWFELPPKAYGGIEWMCYWLAEGLTSRGHEVTLIGAGPDNISGQFVSTFERPPSERITEPLVEAVHVAIAAQAIRDLRPDIVHDHTLHGPLLAFERDVPTVVTTHGPILDDLADYYGALGNSVSLISISGAQRQAAPSLSWAATVHNAIPVSDYPFDRKKESFLLFLGRMSPDKGAHLAVRAANAVGAPIVLAGKCAEPQEQAYFEQCVKPLLRPGVEWIGEADTCRKKDLLRRARCLVMPIQWEEPFGLVMVEAMACGTPVVALRAGSVPEIVDDGVTGYVCQHPDELPGAIERLESIDAAACRQHVLSRFDLGVMVRGYEQAYKKILSREASSAGSWIG